MTINIKTGSLSDFFKSPMETANEIDSGEKVSPKTTIWVESLDLIPLIQARKNKTRKASGDLSELDHVEQDEKELFDYTKWRESLWKGKTVREISTEAMEYQKKMDKTE